MQRLSYLEVSECYKLKLIENKAPNISSFDFAGGEIQLSLGEALQVKKLKLNHWCAISYAIDELASSVPNLEALTYGLLVRRYGLAFQPFQVINMFFTVAISWNIINLRHVNADCQCTDGTKQIPPPQGLEYFCSKLDPHVGI
jgi:hypothetical protein